MQSKSSAPRQARAVFIGLVALLVIGAAVAHFLPAQPSATVHVANPHTVWRICQERTSAELKAPASAAFPSYDEHAISHSGALWSVDSYVDAQNSFGAQLRTRYTCTASFNPNDATYRIEGVQVH
jgi:hypothetical protein